MGGDVFKRAVATIAVKAIGQPRRLADINIVEAVAVDVADRDPVMTIDIDAAGLIEHGSPVVGSMQHLC